VHRRFEEAAARAPEALGEDGLRRPEREEENEMKGTNEASGKKRGKKAGTPKRKKRLKLPFPEENEHTLRDFEEAYLAMMPSGASERVAIGLHRLLEGDPEGGQHCIEPLAEQAQQVGTATDLLRSAAHFAAAGHAETARAWVELVGSKFDPDSDDNRSAVMKPRRAHFDLWRIGCSHLLEGAGLDELEEIILTPGKDHATEDSLMRLHIDAATVYALAGAWDRAFERCRQASAPRLEEHVGELVELLLRRKAWSEVDELLTIVHEHITARLEEQDSYPPLPRLFLQIARTTSAMGVPEEGWKRLSPFWKRVPVDEEARWAAQGILVEALCAKLDSKALWELIDDGYQALPRNPAPQARFVALVARHDPEDNRDWILDTSRMLKRTPDLGQTGALTLGNIAEPMVTFGETDSLLRLYRRLPFGGTPWMQLAAALDTDHPAFPQALENAFRIRPNSTNKHLVESAVEMLRSIYERGAMDSDLYGSLAENWIKEADRDEMELEILIDVFTRGGDVYSAYRAVKQTSKAEREYAVARMAHSALSAGHYSAVLGLAQGISDEFERYALLRDVLGSACTQYPYAHPWSPMDRYR